VSFDPGSRSRLSPHDLPRFAGTSLFDSVARTLCDANCVPRKELYEAWEVARRARRRFRGGRVVDLACGHALVAQLMLLLDDTSPTALAVDIKLPESALRVSDCLGRAWPRLADRIVLQESELSAVPVHEGDVVVSCHACGRLTDDVIDIALAARAKLVVLPCCQSATQCDLGGLSGWLDPALAVDVTRVAKLRAAGYHVHTQTIPAAITAKNRLLLASPTPGSTRHKAS
jgi:hypothetical protein